MESGSLHPTAVCSSVQMKQKPNRGWRLSLRRCRYCSLACRPIFANSNIHITSSRLTAVGSKCREKDGIGFRRKFEGFRHAPRWLYRIFVDIFLSERVALDCWCRKLPVGFQSPNPNCHKLLRSRKHFNFSLQQSQHTAPCSLGLTLPGLMPHPGLDETTCNLTLRVCRFPQL